MTYTWNRARKEYKQLVELAEQAGMKKNEQSPTTPPLGGRYNTSRWELVIGIKESPRSWSRAVLTWSLYKLHDGFHTSHGDTVESLRTVLLRVGLLTLPNAASKLLDPDDHSAGQVLAQVCSDLGQFRSDLRKDIGKHYPDITERDWRWVAYELWVAR